MNASNCLLLDWKFNQFQQFTSSIDNTLMIHEEKSRSLAINSDIESFFPAATDEWGLCKCTDGVFLDMIYF